MRALRFALVAFLCALAPACALVDGFSGGDPQGDDDDDDDDDDVTGTDRYGVFPIEVRAVDMLFVVDNSGTMAEEQEQLLLSFEDFMDELETVQGGMPSLHIGVVSSDMGVSGAVSTVPGCSQFGDDGVLQTMARVEGCNPPVDAYIIDSPDGAGGRETNYVDSLVETFECIASIGTTGCGFEQHLGAAIRAIEQPANKGFRRFDAQLAVIVLADEDDCSVFDGALFDPTNQDVGPMSSFRCFEYGVSCDQDDDARAFGERTNCVPRDDSPYVSDVDQLADTLIDYAGGRSKVFVGSIIGTPTPVNVIPDEQMPEFPFLGPSCDSALGEAFPGIRTRVLTERFLPSAYAGSICNANQDLRRVAQHLVNSIGGTRCLVGTPDLDTCRVFDVTAIDTDDEQRTEIRACDDVGGAPPCYDFVTEVCDFTESGVRVDIDRDTSTSATEVVVECAPAGT